MATCEDCAAAYREAIRELTDDICDPEKLKRLYGLANLLWTREVMQASLPEEGNRRHLCKKDHQRPESNGGGNGTSEINIYLVSYKDYMAAAGRSPERISKHGFVFGCGPETFAVCINGEATSEQQAWTLAHELSHLALGHVDRKPLTDEERADRLSCFVLAMARLLALREAQKYE